MCKNKTQNMLAKCKQTLKLNESNIKMLSHKFP